MRLALKLGSESVRRAIKAVEAYRDRIPEKADELCRRLADIGVDAAVAGIANDESGELRSSIKVDERGDGYAVVADCGYAVYVEFGTGVVGAARPYPGDRPAWASEPLSRTAKAREDGSWVYYDDKQGRFRVTSGQVPQGFMSGAATEIQQRILDEAKEVFGSDRH